MKLVKVVLEAALPREVQPSVQTWTQVVPSAQYTSDKNELDYDPSTGLVRIKSPYSLRCVHVSRVLFMEPIEESAEAPKRRGMPKGGWPKKTEAPHADGE